MTTSHPGLAADHVISPPATAAGLRITIAALHSPLRFEIVNMGNTVLNVGNIFASYDEFRDAEVYMAAISLVLASKLVQISALQFLTAEFVASVK